MSIRNTIASITRRGPWSRALLGTDPVEINVDSPNFDFYESLAGLLRTAQEEAVMDSPPMRQFGNEGEEDPDFSSSDHENDYSDFGDESGEFVEAVEYPQFYCEALKIDEESEIGDMLGGPVGEIVTRKTMNPAEADEMSRRPTWQIRISVVQTTEGTQYLVGIISAKEAEVQGARLRRATTVATQDPEVAREAQAKALSDDAVREIKLPSKTMKLEHAPMSQAQAIQAQIGQINAELPGGYQPVRPKKVRVRVHDKQRDTENRTNGSFEYRGKGGRRLIHSRLNKDKQVASYHTARSLIDSETGKSVSHKPMSVVAYSYSTPAGEITSILPAEWYEKNAPDGSMAKKLAGAEFLGKTEVERDPYVLLYEVADPAERNAMLRRMGVSKSSELMPHTMSAVNILNESGAHNGELSKDNILAFAVNALNTSGGFTREDVKDNQRRQFVPREEMYASDGLRQAVAALGAGQSPREVVGSLNPGDQKFLADLSTSNAILQAVFPGTKPAATANNQLASVVKPNADVVGEAHLLAQSALKAKSAVQVAKGVTPENYNQYVVAQKDLVAYLGKHSPQSLRQFILTQPYVSQTAGFEDPEGLHGARVSAHRKTKFKENPGEKVYIPTFEPNPDSSVSVNWESRFGRVPADDRKLAALETGLRSSAARSVSRYTSLLRNKKLFREVKVGGPNGETTQLQVVAKTPEDQRAAEDTMRFFQTYPYLNAAIRGNDLRELASKMGTKTSDPQVRMLAALDGSRLSEQQDFNLIKKMLDPSMFSKREVPYGLDEDDPSQRNMLTVFVPLNEEAQGILNLVSMRPVDEDAVERISQETGEPEDEIRVALWANRTRLRREIKHSKQSEEQLRQQKKQQGLDPDTKPWAERLLGREGPGGLSVQERAKVARFGVSFDMFLQKLYAENGFAFTQSAPIFSMKDGSPAPDVIQRVASKGEPIVVNLQEYAMGENGKTPEMAQQRYGVTITRDEANQSFSYKLGTKRLNSTERLPAFGDEPLKEYTSGMDEAKLNRIGLTRVPPGQTAGNDAGKAGLGDSLMGDEDRVMQEYNDLQQQPFYRRHRNIAYNKARKNVLEKKFAENQRGHEVVMRKLKAAWANPAVKEAVGQMILPIAKRSAYGMARTKMDARDLENRSRLAPTALDTDRMQDYALQAVSLMLRPEPEVALSAYSFLPRMKDNPNKIDWIAVEKNPATADFARRTSTGDRVAETQSAEEYLDKALAEKFPDPEQRRLEIEGMIQQKKMAFGYSSFLDLVGGYTYALPDTGQTVGKPERGNGKHEEVSPRMKAYEVLVSDSMMRDLSRILPPDSVDSMSEEERVQVVLDAMGKSSVSELRPDETEAFQRAVKTGELPIGFPLLSPERRVQTALQMFGVDSPEKLTGTQKILLDGIKKGRMPMSIGGRLTTEMNRAMSTARTMVQKGSGPMEAMSLDDQGDDERSPEEMIGSGVDDYKNVDEGREFLDEGNYADGKAPMYMEDRWLRPQDVDNVIPPETANIFSALSGTSASMQSRRQEAETLLSLFTDKLKQFQDDIPKTEAMIQRQMDTLPRIQNQLAAVEEQLSRQKGTAQQAALAKQKAALESAHNNAIKNEARWRQESKMLQYSIDKAFTHEDPQNLLRRVSRLRAIGGEYDKYIHAYAAELSDIKRADEEITQMEAEAGQNGPAPRSTKDLRDLGDLTKLPMAKQERREMESRINGIVDQLAQLASEYEREKSQVYTSGAELLMLRRDSITNTLAPGEAYQFLNDMVSEQSMNQIDRLATFANPSEAMPPPYRTVGNLPEAAGDAYASFLDLIHKNRWRQAFDENYWRQWSAETGKEPKNVPGMLAQYLSQLGGMHLVSISRMRERSGAGERSTSVTGDMAGMADYVKHWLDKYGSEIPQGVKLKAMALLEQNFLVPGTLLADSQYTGISDEAIASGQAPPEVAFAQYANGVMKDAGVTAGEDLNRRWLKHIRQAQEAAKAPPSATAGEAIAWYGANVMAPGFGAQYPAYEAQSKQMAVDFAKKAASAPKLNFDSREDYLGYARLTGTAMLTHALFVDEMIAHSQEKGIADMEDEPIAKFLALKALREHEKLRKEYDDALDAGADYKQMRAPELGDSVVAQVEAFFEAYPDKFDDPRKATITQLAQARAAQANIYDHPINVAKTAKEYREKHKRLERDVDMMVYRLRKGYSHDELGGMDKRDLAIHIMQMEKDLTSDEVGQIASRVYWRLHHDVGGQIAGITPVVGDNGRTVVYNPGTSGSVGLQSPASEQGYGGEMNRDRATELIRQPVDMRRRVYDRVGDPAKVGREHFQSEIEQGLGQYAPGGYKKTFHRGMLSPIAPVMLPNKAPVVPVPPAEEVTKAFVLRQMARSAQILDRHGLFALADDVDRLIAGERRG